jgi:hypothetical protein
MMNPIKENADFKNDAEYILLSEYLKEMDELEKKAMQIASDHLGSSFNLLKSNGFIKWKQTRC